MSSLQSVLFDLDTDYNIHDPHIFFKYVKKCLITMHSERKNNKPFINKRLTKEIMRRTRFSNNFFENPTDEKIKTGIFIQII